MELRITTNFPEVQRKLDALQADVRARATASAINKTLDLARTQMTREITAEFNVKAAYVRERLRVKRAFASGALGLQGALIGGREGGRRSANIIAFVENRTTLAEARRRAKAGTLGQLYVQVKKRGGKKPLARAFIGNRGRTVFERVAGTKMASRKWGGKHGEQIRPVQTIDVAQMFNTRRINAAVVRVIESRFPGIVEREARFYVDRFNRTGK